MPALALFAIVFLWTPPHEDRSLAYQRLVHELLQAQRRAIVQLRNEGAISNDVMHRIERDLDLEDTRLEIWPAAASSRRAPHCPRPCSRW